MNKNSSLTRSAIGSLYQSTLKKAASKAAFGSPRLMAKRMSKAFKKPSLFGRKRPAKTESTQSIGREELPSPTPSPVRSKFASEPKLAQTPVPVPSLPPIPKRHDSATW